MRTASPARAPAKARLWPWLPRVAETMPLAFGWRRFSASTKVSPPRTLKAPVGLWFSCLTTASAPSRRAISGQAIAGVGGSAARTTASALLSSSSVNMFGSPPAPQTSALPFSSMTLPISMPASSPSSASSMSLCALPDGIIGKQFSF